MKKEILLPVLFTFTTAFCLGIALSSCEQSQNKKSDPVISNKSLQIDTSKTAVISFDKNSNYPFDDSYNPTTLTQDDINTIDSLLIAFAAQYNSSLDEIHKERSIDFKKYNYLKQLVAATNKKGEKEVWTNYFCYTRDNHNWKKDILLVSDGGNCYFNFKVNLAKKKIYDLSVNGEA